MNSSLCPLDIEHSKQLHIFEGIVSPKIYSQISISRSYGDYFYTLKLPEVQIRTY